MSIQEQTPGEDREAWKHHEKGESEAASRFILWQAIIFALAGAILDICCVNTLFDHKGIA